MKEVLSLESLTNIKPWDIYEDYKQKLFNQFEEKLQKKEKILEAFANDKIKLNFFECDNKIIQVHEVNKWKEPKNILRNWNKDVIEFLWYPSSRLYNQSALDSYWLRDNLLYDLDELKVLIWIRWKKIDWSEKFTDEKYDKFYKEIIQEQLWSKWYFVDSIREQIKDNEYHIWSWSWKIITINEDGLWQISYADKYYAPVLYFC